MRPSFHVSKQYSLELVMLCVSKKIASDLQVHSLDFTFGGRGVRGHRSCDGALYPPKSWHFLLVAHNVGVFEAHRTLLVETAVLLYWIKQALRPNKASFFFRKKPLSRRLGVWPLSPLATPLATCRIATWINLWRHYLQGLVVWCDWVTIRTRLAVRRPQIWLAVVPVHK